MHSYVVRNFIITYIQKIIHSCILFYTFLSNYYESTYSESDHSPNEIIGKFTNRKHRYDCIT